jgi:hypothetical protein
MATFDKISLHATHDLILREYLVLIFPIKVGTNDSSERGTLETAGHLSSQKHFIINQVASGSSETHCGADVKNQYFRLGWFFKADRNLKSVEA